jgi:hypothetical protein
VSDPTDLLAREADAKDALLRDQRRREADKIDLRRFLNGETSRWFVMRLIERAGLFRQTFDVSAPENTHAHAFHEGRRSAALELLNDILDACPEHWGTMLRERAARRDAQAREDKQ